MEILQELLLLNKIIMKVILIEISVQSSLGLELV
jgi:hypothetical protein